MSIPYTITNESITIVRQGKPVTVQKGSANYLPLRRAILEERWDDVPEHLTVTQSLSKWALGKFRVEGTVVYFGDKELPLDLIRRMQTMAAKGEDPSRFFKFWERLQANPSWRSVQQLWPFLSHQGVPITDDGHFLAYKGVKKNFMDVHSGRFLNKPGEILEMPRNQISDDPNEACHVGFHVGARKYASGFGPKVVICKVDPADVVCIPYDHGAQKMRVCKYEVIGHDNGGYMPSTSMSHEDIGTPHVQTEIDTYESDESEDNNDTPYHGDEVGADDASEPVRETSDDADAVLCGECEGTGIVYDSYDHTDCDECDGTGRVDDKDDALNEREKMAADTGNVIGAIKLYRDRTGLGLGESKIAVDKYRQTSDTVHNPEDANDPPFVGKVLDLMEPKDGGYIVSEPKRKAKKGFAKLDKMDMEDLLKQSIDDLRAYAGKGLAIVGASKIPGGKAALVAKILGIRE